MYGTATTEEHRPGLKQKTKVQRPRKGGSGASSTVGTTNDDTVPDAACSTSAVEDDTVAENILAAVAAAPEFSLTAQTANTVKRLVVCGECSKPRVSQAQMQVLQYGVFLGWDHQQNLKVISMI